MDWIIEHINAIAQGASIFAGIIGFFFWMRTELVSLRSDISQIKDHQRLLMESLKQLNTILTQIAVQDTRINMLEKDIDELRHHKGFITE